MEHNVSKKGYDFMDRKIRIAQYGCGKMSHYLMRYVLEKGGELVAAFDMNPAMIGTDIGTHLGMRLTSVAQVNSTVAGRFTITVVSGSPWKLHSFLSKSSGP